MTYDDGLILIAGVLYDEETLEEAELLDTQCDEEGHQPETEDVGDGVTGLGRTHEYVTTCLRCGVGLHAEQDEDGEMFWEVD